MPDKGDAIDYIQAHPDTTPEELDALATTQSTANPANPFANTGAVVTRMSDVVSKKVEWLWPERIPIGKVTLIAGDPGLGKSLLTIALAAHVTNGKPWPVDGTPCPLGGVVMLSAEDEADDTIKPRLEAAGADVDVVVKMEMTKDIDDKGNVVNRWISLKTDIETLGRVIAAEGGRVKLVIIDPVSAFSGGTDTHNNAETRVVLGQLAAMATEHRVAVVAITHLNKSTANAMYRTTGSLAFVAAARAAFLVTKDPDDLERRLVLPMKTNLAKDIGGVAYRIEQTIDDQPILVFEPDPVFVDPDEALAPDPDDKRAALEEAKEWLAEELALGAVLAVELQKAAAQAGHAWGTVKRAKTKLRVKSYHAGYGKSGKWWWKLPPKAEEAPAPELDPLKEKTGPKAEQKPSNHAGFTKGDQVGGAELIPLRKPVTCNDCDYWWFECRKGHQVRDCARPIECPDFTPRSREAWG